MNKDGKPGVKQFVVVVAHGGVSPNFAAAQLSAQHDGAEIGQDVDTGELVVLDETWAPDTLAAFNARKAGS